ncbi:MAG TPA: hypothetical protein VFK14_06855 [Solirubrobacterales bacterium]|nr:hypothetical protein [Solirubrobacterales bacterium]
MPMLLLAGTTPATAHPLVTGVTNIESQVPLGFARTKATGASFVRIPLDWSTVAPVREPASWQPQDPADPAYDWQPTDDAVAAALSAGLVPVLQVNDGPGWAQRCVAPDFAMVSLCNTDPDALAAFATAAARHYDGQGAPRVQYWQVLNEPNLSLFFNPQFDGRTPVSPGLYRVLLNRFYAAVKAVDRSDLVIAAGLGPIAVPSYTVGPLQFARLLLCMQGRNHPRPTKGDCEGGVDADILAVHPYTSGGPTHEGGVNDVELGNLGALRALIDAADRAGRIHGAFRHTPLWITEFSWDSRPPDPGGLPMRILKRWVAEALYVSWRAGVTHFFWYSLRDSRHAPGERYSETLESGLYFRGATLEQDRPKPSLNAFRFPFVSYTRRRGLSYWGRTPTSTPGKVVIQVHGARHWRRAAVARADGSGIFRGTIRTRYGRGHRGTVRARYRGVGSIPFSLKPVPDFRQPPFG